MGNSAISNTYDGMDGNDRITGGLGDDVLSGGSGDDKIYGSLGSNTLDGGSGEDVLRYSRKITYSCQFFRWNYKCPGLSLIEIFYKMDILTFSQEVNLKCRFSKDGSDTV